MKTVLAAVGIALTTASAADAVTMTVWTIDAGVQFYDSAAIIQAPPPPNPVAGTLTGTFVFDTTVQETVSVDFEVTGLSVLFAEFNGSYDVLGLINQTQLQAGSAEAAVDFTGEKFVGIIFDEELSDFSNIGDQVALARALGTTSIFPFLATCNVGSATGCGNPAAQLIFDGTATLTQVVAPVPFPAGLPLLVLGIGAMVGLRLRGIRSGQVSA